MGQDFIINNPSEELLVEALQSLPGKPESVSVDFLASGIRVPYYEHKGEDFNGYIKSCKENRIIPFSSQEIHSTPELERSISKKSSGIELFSTSPKDRINQISVNIKKEKRFEISSRLNKILLPEILDNNYKIETMYVMLSGYDFYDFTGGTGGHLENAGLYFNLLKKEGSLVLAIEPRCPTRKMNAYSDWFEGLRKKYSKKKA
jgi:hypothetical protein